MRSILRDRNTNRHYRRHKVLVAFLFVLPSIVFFILMKYLPMFECVYDSLFNYNLGNPPGNWVGLRNYVNTFRSSLFWQEMGNTVILWGYGILFGFFTPLIQALLLNELRRGKGLLRYLYILPAGIPTIAGVTVWKNIWQPEGGLANALMGMLGLSEQQWIYSAHWVKFCLRFPSILGGGMGLLIYIVAINNVPWEIQEAAIVDGASAWNRLWRITLPNIRYMIEIQFLLSLTSSLLAFDDVYLMTKGGPQYSSTTAVLGVYTKSFMEQNFGQAMSMSVVIFLCTLGVTIVELQLQKRSDS